MVQACWPGGVSWVTGPGDRSATEKRLASPAFTWITFEWDLDKRTARIEVPNIVWARSEPIRIP
jgi:hypothetical protein